MLSSVIASSIIGISMMLNNVNIEVENRTYKNNFNKEHQKINYYYHGGGKSLKEDLYRKNIKATLSQLSFIPEDNQNIVELLVETSEIESFKGKYIKQIGGGPALGVYQIEMNTYNDLIKWLKIRKLDKQVMKFYDKKSTLKENLKTNIPFQNALVVSHYYRYYGDELNEIAKSIFNRAIMWKKRYNTYKGKGTIEAYLSRNFISIS